MFKRVTKRQRKRKKEDELGLDEEMKQVLGLQDTDSDESFDSSDFEVGNESDLDLDDSGGEEETEDDDAGSTQNTSRKRKHSAEDSHSDSKPIGSEDESFDDEEEFMSADDRPPMGIIAATTNPIYDIPDAQATQDLRACVLCPGKLLKNAHMVNVHAESTAHLRRLQHYVAQVAKLTSSPDGLNTDDPRVILQGMTSTQNSAHIGRDVSSKRSQRRTAWKAKRAERKKAKIHAKAERSSKEKAKEDSTASKPTKSEGVHLGGPKDIPVSTCDLPSKTSGRGKQGASKCESADQDRPRKRPKHEHTPGTASSTKSKVGTTSDAQPPSKSASGETRRKKPSLKRNDTSLYFADDENRSGLLNKPQRSNLGVSVNEMQQKKHSKSSSGTKRRIKLDSNGGIRYTKGGLSAREEGNKKSRGLGIPKGGKGKG